MGNWLSHFAHRLVNDLGKVDSTLAMLVVIVIAAVMMIDAVTKSAAKKRKASGLTPKSTAVSIDGSKTLPVREYISEIQRLAGKPDALVSEGGFIIPVERKPLARKLRDRYVAQLLVYMRLVEEFEGKKPPYGYLILGPNCRKFKIENSEERQKWLSGVLEEMKQVVLTGKSKPTPHPRKCPRCDVKNFCAFKAADTERAQPQSSAEEE